MLVLLGAATLLAVAGGHLNPHVELSNLAVEVRPGQQVDKNLNCAWSVGDGWQTYCRVGKVTFVSRRDVVKRIKVNTDQSGLTIGQLIVEWGQPLAVDYSTFGPTAVYWNDRYVYLMPSGPFTPGSKVDSITFTDADQAFDGYYKGGDIHANWHGFATSKRSS
jgi:hypothetical protein